MANTNGLEAVPWMVDGGRHTADIGRTLAFAATQGSEGVVGPTDLKISATAGTADGQVHMDVGAAVIRNRSTNAKSQSYVTRALTASHLDVGSTGASGRSDLVVVRIKDPQFPPWSPVADPTVGPYAFPEIIPGVSAGTTNAKQVAALASHSAYAVARIDIPPNKSAITQDMIKDLRQLAQMQAHRSIEIGAPTPESYLNSPLGRIWPDYRPQFWVPEWAVGATGTAILSSVGLRGGSTQGIFTMVLGSLRASNVGYDLDAPSQGGSRHTLVVAGGWQDVRSIAGTWQEVHLETRSQNDAGDLGDLVTVAGTQQIFDIQFYAKTL